MRPSVAGLPELFLVFGLQSIGCSGGSFGMMKPPPLRSKFDRCSLREELVGKQRSTWGVGMALGAGAAVVAVPGCCGE